MNKDTNNKTFVRNMFISLIIIMTFNSLVTNTVGMIDFLCINSLVKNPNAVTAYELFSPLSQIMNGISAVFALGGEVVITKLLAKGESKKANRCFSTNTLFTFLLGLLFFVFCFFGSNIVAQALGSTRAANPVEVTKFTEKYLRGFMIGVPFMFLQQFLIAMVYLDGDRKRATVSIVSTMIINTTFDLLAGFYIKDAGTKVFSIGLASSLSFIVSCGILSTHFFSKKYNFKVKLKEFTPSFIKNNFLAGIPIGFKDVMITLRVYILNMIYLSIGSNIAINAHGYESTITNLFQSGLGGLISTIIMMSGVFYNEEDEKSLNTLLKDTFVFTFLVNGVLSIIYFFTAPYLAGIMTKDIPIYNETVYSMRCQALIIVFATMNTAFLSFFQGTKRSAYSMIVTALQNFALPVLFVFILGRVVYNINGTMHGLWIGGAFGFFFYSIVHFTWAFIRARKIKFDARTLFFIRKDFGYKEDDVLELSIDGLNDINSIAEKVLSFTNKYNIDNRRKQNLANCAEELGMLIIVSGFAKDPKRKHHASIRISYKPAINKLLIRTRDDCEKFDIVEKIKKVKEMAEYDSIVNCSIRMIVHMAKDVDYAHVLKTNNMIIAL